MNTIVNYVELQQEVEWAQLCLFICRKCGITNLQAVHRFHTTASEEVHPWCCWGSLMPQRGTQGLQFTSTINETELPFLDINLYISEDRIQTSVFFTETDTHQYFHFSSFHPDQFLHLHQLCLDNDDFLIKSREMIAFFSQWHCPLTSLQQDLCKVTTISSPDALSRSDWEIQMLIECLWSSHTTHLTSTSNGIFPKLPFVAHQRDLNLRDILVHSTYKSSIEQPGSHACQCSLCHTCEFINPLTKIQGPKSTFTIHDHFTYTSEKSCVLHTLL